LINPTNCHVFSEECPPIEEHRVLVTLIIVCVNDHVVHARKKLHFVDFVNQVTNYVVELSAPSIEVTT